jgi:FAD/FMN-containing dehydrogenase
MRPSAADWAALQGMIAGEVVLPSSPGYDLARKPAIARFHAIRPQAVVQCRAPADVTKTIAMAHRFRLPAAARSGGHCFAGRSSTRGIVIDVTPMRSVSVSGGVATVGAGARLGEVYEALAEHGLAIPAGCGPGVGIAGLTLGGGFGILGRRYGLACDRLLGAQIVLADGHVIDCDAFCDRELFWALRGAGGGNFGVVTSLTFATVPAPHVTVFHLAWPYGRAARVIEAWQAWAPTAPGELAASLLVTTAGDLGQRPSVNLFGAMLGSEPATVGLLGELAARAGADPASAFSKHLPYRQAKQYLAALGDRMTGTSLDQRPETGNAFSKSEFFRRSLPSEVIAALVGNLEKGRAGGQSRELDFTPWGGAYNRVPVDAMAFAHRNERFLLKHTVAVDADAPAHEQEAAQRWLARSWAAVHPWGAGGVYPNFPDPDLKDPARLYHGSNYNRLVRAKARYDPDNFFRFHQSVPPRADTKREGSRESWPAADNSHSGEKANPNGAARRGEAPLDHKPHSRDQGNGRAPGRRTPREGGVLGATRSLIAQGGR